MKKAILTTALLLTMVGSAIGQDMTANYAFYGQTFKIPIDSAFTNTGFNVAAGKSYSLVVRGMASTDGFKDWVGPAGDFEIAGPTFPLPGHPSQSVIGKIGSNGTPFYVGDQLNFTANVSGTLYLGYNDVDFSQNHYGGYYMAFLAVGL